MLISGIMDYNLARNVILYDELDRLLAGGLPAVVLSGAALGRTVYPSIAQRPMSDIDLLTDEDRMDAFGSTLGALGWMPDSGRSSEQHYQKTVGGFTIHLDLHTSIPYLDRTGLEKTWSAACRVPFGNTTALVLTPADTLIYSAADAIICHARVTDTCLTDITLIIQKYADKIDWPSLIRMTRQCNLEAPLYYVFSRANRKMNAGIPRWVLDKIKPAGRKALELYFYRRFMGDGLGDDLAPILRFIIRPHRFKLLLDSFFPSPDFMMRRYGLTGKNTLFLFYPIRLINHLGRIGKMGVRILNKK